MQANMAGSLLHTFWIISLCLVPGWATDIAKRKVLTDLSGGFCRSYKFGVSIANEVLYMIDLDGGLLPGDHNASNNYLVTLDLASRISLSEGENYKMDLIDPSFPVLKDQALWSNKANTSLYVYGGSGLGNTSADGGSWKYDIAEKSWVVQQNSIKPARLVGGAHTNAPSTQAAYWIGGYQSSDTTLAITDKTKVYGTSMLQFNTTTEEYTSLDAPYTAVEEGGLVFLPVGEMGILVYLGGEVPSVQDGVNATLAPNPWDHVQVYDIASGKWYNQSTTGTVPSRTQFCASVEHDESSSSYQIYVLGGADFESEDVLSDVSYLSIPSFKWYRAGSLDQGRMTLSCETYGRQIFGVGGRLAWSADQGAGCYDMPAFIYDSQSEVVRTDFDPALSTYSIPSATSNDIEESPYTSSWADPALKALFVSDTGSNSSTPSNTAQNDTSHSVNKGAIAGGVVGGVAGVAIIIALLCFFLIRRRKQKQLAQQRQMAKPAQWVGPAVVPGFPPQELPSSEVREELDSRPRVLAELQGDDTHELHA